MRLEELALNLIIPDEFGIDYDISDMEEDFLLDELMLLNTKFLSNGSIKFHFGVSKLCISNYNENYVIKIPFCGHRNYLYRDGQIQYSDWFFEKYNCAKNSTRTWDYCLDDVEVCNKAKSSGYERFFAMTEYVGQSYEHPIYKQEKVETFNQISEPRKNSQAANHKAEELHNKYWHLPTKFIADMIDFYGEEETLGFLQYADDNDIDDLHGNNIGYRVSDGSPCLLDYSGWWD